MGNESSKESSSPEAADSSLSSRLKDRLHLHSIRRHLHRHGQRGGTGSGSGAYSAIRKLRDADHFAGIALLTIRRAEMKFKDKWLACVSFGEQTFRTQISDQTEMPVWNSGKKLLLEKDGPHVARISLFETNKVSSNKLIGYCEVNLLEFLTQCTAGIELPFSRSMKLKTSEKKRRRLLKDMNSDSEILDLLDPSSSDLVVGKICISCSVEDPVETEKGFARRILSIVDYDQDGKLSFSEFSQLITAFGNQLAEEKKEELFKAADTNGDNVVSMDELASLLAIQQEKEPILTCCPVCGEALEVSDNLNNIIHLTLCFDEGTGNQVMTGGFLTDTQASYGWMFKLSEWAHYSSYDVGLKSGSSASHILITAICSSFLSGEVIQTSPQVFDRRTKRLVEELIDGKIVLSMRAIYQSKIGLGLMDKGAKELLQSISEKQGRKMDSVESAQDIPQFVASYKGQINLAEAKHPLEHYKTFNEFFVRELKPGARPIACMERDDVAVCASDCRLMAFKSVDESLRFWIKGRKFSIEGLLGQEVCSRAFIDGSLVIFRLAPQDYHRFHLPVTGTIEKFVEIPGCLYTVNPIAVNSKYCNVFTENKRVLSIISTAEFGKVAFVAIGATMVGSMTFLKKEGDLVKKGEQFGYFSFGGSTVICVFEKDSINIDEDLLANSSRPLETLVSVGMQLGVSRKTSNVVLPNLKTCSIQD